MQTLYKADGTVTFDTLTKASDDAGELTAIIYAPEHPDTDDHVADTAVIKDMAYHFQKEGGQIDIRHNGQVVDKDRAYVAESFIVQKGDPRFLDYKDDEGNPVNTEGAWATVTKIDDPKLRQLYRDGEWNGISMQGTGVMSVEKSDEAAPSWFSKFLKAVGIDGPPRNTNSTEVDDMKIEEMEALLKAQTEALLKGKEVKTAEIKKEDEIDLTDPKAVQELATKLAKEELRKNFDLTDVKAVQELATQLAKADEDRLAKAEANDSDEVKQLRAQLRKAEGVTRSPAKSDDQQLEFAGLTKEEVSQCELGDAMADYLNGKVN